MGDGRQAERRQDKRGQLGREAVENGSFSGSGAAGASRGGGRRREPTGDDEEEEV